MPTKQHSNHLLVIALGLLLLSGGINAQELHNSDGYSVTDFSLETAGDLYDVCTLEMDHPDYGIATAFCLGFFEGAWHYDDTISGLSGYVDLVCSPDGTTRSQAVTVFVEHQQDNGQHRSEAAIDGVFRALSAAWPCP